MMTAKQELIQLIERLPKFPLLLRKFLDPSPTRCNASY